MKLEGILTNIQPERFKMFSTSQDTASLRIPSHAMLLPQSM